MMVINRREEGFCIQGTIWGCRTVWWLLALASPAEGEAFEYIYTHYKGLMLQKAYGILRDPMLAEDAVSEAFIRIYKNMRKIEDPASNRCLAFVATITRNTALTLLQKERRQPAELPDEEQPDGFNLEEHVLTAVSAERMLALMDGLNEELRSVFLLKYAYDLPHKTIGRLLGITENNVNVRLYRAKKKIAALLAKEGYTVEAKG